MAIRDVEINPHASVNALYVYCNMCGIAPGEPSLRALFHHGTTSGRGRVSCWLQSEGKIRNKNTLWKNEQLKNMIIEKEELMKKIIIMYNGRDENFSDKLLTSEELRVGYLVVNIHSLIYPDHLLRRCLMISK